MTQETPTLHRLETPLVTPSDLSADATRDIGGALTAILADVYALYLKTRNFHWHVSGPHFHDYHLMFDSQAGQLLAMTDPIAERTRKIGGMTLRSVGQIARLQTVLDNDAGYVTPGDMLAELREDNKALASRLRVAHDICAEHRDIATASLIETWIDQTEQRTWFLFETGRRIGGGQAAVPQALGALRPASGGPPAPAKEAAAPRNLPAAKPASGSAAALEAVRKLERQRIEAIRTNDDDAMSDILDDDFIYINSSGTLFDKPAYIRAVDTHAITYSGDMKLTETDHRVDGDMVILAGEMLGHARVEGEPQVYHLRSMRVWRRRDDAWRLLAWQASALW